MRIITFTLERLATMQFDRQVAQECHAKYLNMRHCEERQGLSRYQLSQLYQDQPLILQLHTYFWMHYPAAPAILPGHQRDYNAARFFQFLDTVTPEEIQTALKSQIDQFPAHAIMGLFV